MISIIKFYTPTQSGTVLMDMDFLSDEIIRNIIEDLRRLRGEERVLLSITFEEKDEEAHEKDSESMD